MDSSGLKSSTSTSISSNRKCKAEASAIIQSRRAKFFETYLPQDFSLPDSITFYMAENPKSPELYEKMIQTCKYFFVKNQILVTSLFFFSGEWRFSFNERSIDLSKLASKLWIIDRLYVEDDIYIKKKSFNQNLLSSVVPKIDQCDAKHLTIESQVISFNDLSLLISAAEEIHFKNVTFRNKDGSNVGIEKIVEIAVKAKEIEFKSDTALSNITSETMEELLMIPHFSKLDELILEGIPETFDLESFYGYMKQNKITKLGLSFDDSFSEVYMNRLEEIVDEILATETHDYMVPCFNFVGLDEDKEDKLRDLSLLFKFI